MREDFMLFRVEESFYRLLRRFDNPGKALMDKVTEL